MGSIFWWVSGGSRGSQSTWEQRELLTMEAVVELWSIRLFQPTGRKSGRKSGIVWREKDFLYPFGFSFMLRGKSQPDRKRKRERLFLLLWEDRGRMTGRWGWSWGSLLKGFWSPLWGSGQREGYLRREGHISGSGVLASGCVGGSGRRGRRLYPILVLILKRNRKSGHVH